MWQNNLLAICAEILVELARFSIYYKKFKTIENRYPNLMSVSWISRYPGLYFFLNLLVLPQVLFCLIHCHQGLNVDYEVVYLTTGSPAFCLALYLTGVHFRGELQPVGHVGGKKIKCRPIRTRGIHVFLRNTSLRNMRLKMPKS